MKLILAGVLIFDLFHHLPLRGKKLVNGLANHSNSPCADRPLCDLHEEVSSSEEEESGKEMSKQMEVVILDSDSVDSETKKERCVETTGLSSSSRLEEGKEDTKEFKTDEAAAAFSDLLCEEQAVSLPRKVDIEYKYQSA